MDAVVLVGGLGTRLRSLVADVPKPMAPIGGVPFLDILLTRLLQQPEIERVLLAVGYKREVVQAYFKDEKLGRPVIYAVEREPLGTGGGILNAVSQTRLGECSSEVLVLNGDTLFDVDVAAMLQQHRRYRADITLAIKPMQDFERYGTVAMDEVRITGFKEKQYCASGNINGGVYLIGQSLFEKVNFERLPRKFSFETDVLERYVARLKMYGFVSKGYFIDIGIPADYSRAQIELVGDRTLTEVQLA